MPTTTKRDLVELVLIVAGLTILTTVLLQVPFLNALGYVCLTLLVADYYAN